MDEHSEMAAVAESDVPAVPAPPDEEEWSSWFPFDRSTNIAAARCRLDQSGVWQVMFGGKPKPPTKKNPLVQRGITPISCHEYGPSPILTDDLFVSWCEQYLVGGSAGIWFDLHVKRTGVQHRPLWSQGA